MSTLSYLIDKKNKKGIYLSNISYWNEKKIALGTRILFSITKIIEIYTYSKNKSQTKPEDSFENLVEPKQNPEPIQNKISKDPIISIVIPSYISKNEHIFYIARLLKNINSQSLKPNFIILIDDESPLCYDIPDEVIFKKMNVNSGPGKARNEGSKIALEMNSDIVVFTDVDCIPDKEWIKSICQSFLENRNANLISGKTVSYNKNWLGRYQDINGTLNGRSFVDSDYLLYGPTCNLAVTKEVAEQIRFNEIFKSAACEDIEYCYNAMARGYYTFFSQKSLVRHDYGYKKYKPLKNLEMFRNQFKKYAQAESKLIQAVPNYYFYFSQTREISNEKI